MPQDIDDSDAATQLKSETEIKSQGSDEIEVAANRHKSPQIVVEHLSARAAISMFQSRLGDATESDGDIPRPVPQAGEEGYRPYTLYGPRKPASRIW